MWYALPLDPVEPNCSCCLARSLPPTKPMATLWRNSWRSSSISGEAAFVNHCKKEKGYFSCGSKSAIDVKKNKSILYRPFRKGREFFVCHYWELGGVVSSLRDEWEVMSWQIRWDAVRENWKFHQPQLTRLYRPNNRAFVYANKTWSGFPKSIARTYHIRHILRSIWKFRELVKEHSIRNGSWNLIERIQDRD